MKVSERNESKDPFHITFLGHVLARNVGCSVSRGEWLCALTISLLLTLLINIVACLTARGIINTLTLALSPWEDLYIEIPALTLSSAGVVNLSQTELSEDEIRNASSTAAVLVAGESPRRLQPFWELLSLQYSHITATFAFPGFLGLLTYFLGCTPYAFVDTFCVSVCRKYKIQSLKHPAKKGSWYQTLVSTIEAQFSFSIPGMLAQDYILRGPWAYSETLCATKCPWGGTQFPILAPSLLQCLAQFLTTFAVFDAAYFTWHALHHRSKPLYKYIHSKHHIYRAPFVWVTQYVHFLELIVVASLSMVIPIAARCHPLVQWFWLIFIVLISIDSHSGYEFPIFNLRSFPCCGGAQHHDRHHETPTSNYQPFLTWLDSAFSTHYDDLLKRRKNKKAR